MADVTRYIGTVRLDPAAGEVKTDMTLTLTSHSGAESEYVLYLNKALHIDAFDCGKCSGYTFDTSKLNQVQFVPHGVPLTVQFKQPLRKGQTATVHLRYSGHIVPDAFGVNLLTPDWTELALYSGWYPYHAGSHSYRFDIRVQMDRAYKVSGNAEVKGKAGDWRLVEDTPTSDIVLVAARDLKTQVLERGGMKLRIDSAGGVSDSAVEQFAREIADIVSHYSQWYGPSGMSDARFVLHRRVSGGGYVRPRFMSIPYSGGNEIRGVAHEVGHFWWLNAPVTSWEDWLNEGFAEYSSLRYVRDAKSKDAFLKENETARQRGEGKPAIWGIARNDPNAYDVLYGKGALRLLALEEMIGTAKFDALLTTMHQGQVRDTEAFLNLLQRQTSPEIRQKFEKMLQDR